MTRWAATCALLVAAACASSETPAAPTAVSQVPAQSPAPIRVLMLTATAAFRHDSIPVARAAMTSG